MPVLSDRATDETNDCCEYGRRHALLPDLCETMRPVFSEPRQGLCLSPVLACCLGSKCVGTCCELLFICFLHFRHATRYLGPSILLILTALLTHSTAADAEHQSANSTGLATTEVGPFWARAKKLLPPQAGPSRSSITRDQL